MSKPFTFLKLCIFQFVTFLPGRVLRVMEAASQSAQGKGWVRGVEEEIRAIQHLAKNAGIRRPVVLDVGANVGSWTSSLKKIMPESEVHAFEPSSVAFACLQKLQGALIDVHIYPLGLGKEAKRATLYFDEPASTKASLIRRRLDHIDIILSSTEDVQITTLDAWQAEFNIFAPNVLKLDVEGNEFDVLQGGENLLKSIKVVQFEFGGSNIDSRVFFQDFWYFFLERGFYILRLTPRGLRKVTRYDEIEETFRFTIFYAVR